MLSIFAPLISWIFRSVIMKFIILTAVFAVMALVVPMAIDLITPFLGASSLTSAFSGLPSGAWWVLDNMALDYGLPLMISAVIARFLIRRLPFIG